MKKTKYISTLYYLQNRKKLLAYQKEYYYKNLEQRRAYARKQGRCRYLNEETREKIKEYSAEYRKKNRESIRKYAREYKRKKRAEMKQSKSNKQAHTSTAKKGQGDWHVSHSSMGMGDYYGTGVKAKLGRMRDDSMGMRALSPKKMKTPPRSVV